MEETKDGKHHEALEEDLPKVVNLGGQNKNGEKSRVATIEDCGSHICEGLDDPLLRCSLGLLGKGMSHMDAVIHVQASRDDDKA